MQTSNPGHLLFTGVVKEEYAQRVGETLMNNRTFCGWGIRTVADGEARYNPMSYHNGSVWPHDNSIAAAGLARYGQKKLATKVLTGMFEASRYFEYSLPELFCGFEKRAGQGPIMYPVSCAPQAWAAASVFLFIQACLGLEIDALSGTVIFNKPDLPDWLHRMCLRKLKVGDKGWVDLEVIRREGNVAIHVLESEGRIAVQTLR